MEDLAMFRRGSLTAVERSGLRAAVVAFLIPAAFAASCRGSWGQDAVQPEPGGEKPAAEPVSRYDWRRRPIADILPGDAAFAMAIGKWSDIAKALSETPPARIWAEPEIRAFIGEPLAGFREMLEHMAPSEIWPIAELRAMFQGPVAVAMGSCGGTSRAPLAAVAALNADPGIKYLAKMAVKWSGTTAIVNETYEDAEIFRTEKSEGPCLSFHGGWLVVSDDPAFLKRILDGIDGRLKVPLSKSDLYSKAGLSGGEHFFAMLDSGNLPNRREPAAADSDRPDAAGRTEGPVSQAAIAAASVLPSTASAMTRFRAAVEWLGGGTAAWVCGIEMRGGAFETRLRIERRKGGGCFASALSEEGVPLDAFKVCPPDAPIAIAARFRPEGVPHFAISAARSALGEDAAKDFDARMADIEASNGSALRKGLMENLEGNLVITSFARQAAEDPAAVWTAFVLILDVKDPAAADNAIPPLMKYFSEKGVFRILKGVPVSRTDFEGVAIHYLPVSLAFSPSAAVVGSKLVLGTNLFNLKRVVRHMKAGGRSLADSELFRSAAAGAGDGGASVLGYFDAGWAFHEMYGGMLRLLRLAELVAGLPGDWGARLAGMPAPESVSRHLFPSLTKVRAEGRSVTVMHRGPLPSAFLAAMAVCAITGPARSSTPAAGKASPPPVHGP